MKDKNEWNKKLTELLEEDFRTTRFTGHCIIAPDGEMFNCELGTHECLADNILQLRNSTMYEKNKLYCLDTLIKMGYIAVDCIEGITVKSCRYDNIEQMPQAMLNTLMCDYIQKYQDTFRCDIKINMTNIRLICV